MPEVSIIIPRVKPTVPSPSSTQSYLRVTFSPHIFSDTPHTNLFFLYFKVTKKNDKKFKFHSSLLWIYWTNLPPKLKSDLFIRHAATHFDIKINFNLHKLNIIPRYISWRFRIHSLSCIHSKSLYIIRFIYTRKSSGYCDLQKYFRFDFLFHLIFPVQ